MTTLRHTREALDALLDYAEPDLYENAAAELALAEAVIEAAWQIIHGGDSTRALGPFDLRTPTLFALRDALAALDAAQKDGQTEGVEPGRQKASGVAPATTGDESPVPPSACPCDGTDCVC